MKKSKRLNALKKLARERLHFDYNTNSLLAILLVLLINIQDPIFIRLAISRANDYGEDTFGMKTVFDEKIVPYQGMQKSTSKSH